MAGAFLWNDLVRAATLINTGTSPATMPIANLQDPQPRLRTRWLGSTAGLIVDFGADVTVEAVALLSSTLRAADTVRVVMGPQTSLFEEGATFDLRFTQPNTVVSPPGTTFNRASDGWCFDSAGQLVVRATNVARYDYDPSTLACRGLLLEEARTNTIRNPRAEGSTPGSPGVMPTNWGVVASGGISTTVIGTGTEAGIPYFDLQITGTTAGVGAVTVLFDTATNAAAAALVTQRFSVGAFLRLVGGSWGTPLVGPAWQLLENSGAGALLATNTSAAMVLPGAGGLAGQRREYSAALGNASVAFVQGALTVSWATGTAVNLTLRIGAPQLERGRTLSSPILPPVGAPAAAARAADQTRITGLSIADATLLIDCTNLGGNESANVTLGGFGPNNDFNNSTYFVVNPGGAQTSLVNGVAGVGRIVNFAVGYGVPTALVAGINTLQAFCALNASVGVSTSMVTLPANVDRVAIGGNPWGGAASVGIAQGVGWYRRVALYPKRLADAQMTGLATVGSTLVTGAIVWDSGLLTADTDGNAQGNVIVVPASPATARYMLVGLSAPGAALIDVGRLVAGPLWRVSRAVALGAQEGRRILDRRERNELTAAEFPVPALVNPRMASFNLALLSNAEAAGAWRSMRDRLAGAGEALWIPELSLTRAEMNQRALWGAIAMPGDDAALTRDFPQHHSRAFRIQERL